MDRILIVGHKGELGSVLTEELSKENAVVTTKHKFPSVDFKQFVVEGRFDYIINCACKKRGDWQSLVSVNIELPLFLESKGSKLLHFCTDAVYSGKEGNYDKGSIHDPVCDYGKTKSVASKLLSKSTIIRMSFIPSKIKDEVEDKILKGNFYGWENYIWSGVLLEDLSKYVCLNFKNMRNGVILIGGDKITKFDLYRKLNKTSGKVKNKKLEKTIDRSYCSDVYLPVGL